MPAQCTNARQCPSEQGLWTPAALRPSIWVKSNDAKTIIVSGGVVTSVIDVSSGVPFSVTGSVSLDTSQLNNKPTLRLNNSSTNQLLTASYSYAGNEITLISLHRNAATAGGRTVYGRLFSLYKTGELDYGTANGGILTYGVGGVNGVRFYRNTNTNVTSSPTINDVWGCAVLTRSGTGVTMALDGGSRVSGTTASNNFNFDKVRIGNDDGPREDSGMNGYIAENILITRAITQEEENKLFGYLAWEWGRVTSLPIGHPYRFAPPRDNRILTRKRRAVLFMAGAAGVPSASITAETSTRTRTAIAQTVTPGAVTITAETATRTRTAQAQTVAAGAVTISCETATRTRTGVSPTATGGAVSIACETATRTRTGVEVSVSATASITAETATRTRTAIVPSFTSTVTISCETATRTRSALAVSVIPGTVAVTAETAARARTAFEVTIIAESTRVPGRRWAEVVEARRIAEVVPARRIAEVIPWT